MVIHMFNPIWAGLWNDVVDWGGTSCPDLVFRRVPPLNIFGNIQKKIFLGLFWDVSNIETQSAGEGSNPQHFYHRGDPDFQV